MHIYLKSQIKEIENLTCINQSVNHIQLIQRAAAGFCENFIVHIYKKATPIIIFAGNGNNGADAIEIANILSTKGLDVSLYIIPVTDNNSEEFNELANHIYKSVETYNILLSEIGKINITEECYIIDGLFGAGLSKTLGNSIQLLVEKLNKTNTIKVAIDIPTGLQCDGTIAGNVLKCNFTVALGLLKPAYFLHYSEDYIGKLLFSNIGLSTSNTGITDGLLLDKNYVRNRIRIAPRICHKYQRGSALLIGGQYGMVGCMKLAGEAALRSGCGLITLHVPKCAVEFLQGALPEAIIDPDENFYTVGLAPQTEKYQSIGIGPGMGLQTKQTELIRSLIEKKVTLPMIWDADALKIIGNNPHFIDLIPPLSILTPHAGEFATIFHKNLFGKELHEFALEMADKYKLIIVFKGADTIIYTPESKYYVNSTGNNGMATAGSGDVLTGIITGLLAQGYSPVDAACLGVYFHGLAGDLAVEQLGHNSLIASDIIKFLGHAFIQFNEK